MLYTTLHELISKPERSRHREYLLTTQFIRDVVLAAGRAGYDLLVYLPTVDSDGFDVILDDRYRLLPLQLKSVIGTGKTSAWRVHKTLLWPDPEDAKTYGLNPSWTEHGRAGGVVLVTVALQDDALVTRYAYTDIDILAAMWYEIWPLKLPQKKCIDRLQIELSDRTRRDITLPRSAFLKVESVEQLLPLMGLDSRIENSWRTTLRAALHQINCRTSQSLGSTMPDIARKELQKLVTSLGERRSPRTDRERRSASLRELKEHVYRMERLRN